MKYRYEEFDSIRGIAALTVLFHHCLIVIPAIFSAHEHHETSSQVLKAVTNTPLHLVWAGHEAVILFFILSGFVLYLSISNNKSFEYKEYVVKRFCRIYLPYLVTMILSILLYMSYQYFDLIDNSYKGTSEWFNKMWSEKLDIKTIISIIFMLGFHTHNLNTVTWSLIHELRISIVFPFIVYFVNKGKIKYPFQKILVLFTIIWLTLTYFSKLELESNIQYFLFSFGSTSYYAIFFIMGCILAKNIAFLKNFFENKSVAIKTVILSICFILYLNEWIFPSVGILKYSSSMLFSNLANTIIDLIIGCSVCLLFSILVSSKKAKIFLKKRYFLFIGKISFSLYLIHPIILMSFIHLFSDYIYLPILIIVSIIVSIISSHYLYNYIELPSISIGKKIISVRKKSKVA